MLEGRFGADAPRFGAALVTMGLAYHKVAKYDEAESVFEQGLEILEKMKLL
ncbi:MAG: tetratricopeptide repeat-containing protein [Desulfobacterales bacterium]|nr:tetratricopeptide repeat-containing protein [Desulfobacterales bacterium]